MFLVALTNHVSMWIYIDDLENKNNELSIKMHLSPSSRRWEIIYIDNGWNKTEGYNGIGMKAIPLVEMKECFIEYIKEGYKKCDGILVNGNPELLNGMGNLIKKIDKFIKEF